MSETVELILSAQHAEVLEDESEGIEDVSRTLPPSGSEAVEVTQVSNELSMDDSFFVGGWFPPNVESESMEPQMMDGKRLRDPESDFLDLDSSSGMPGPDHCKNLGLSLT